jgi:hypothetical protein
MTRKILMALTVLALVGAALTSPAEARWHGHWHGGYHRHWHGGWGWGFGPAFGFGFAGGYYGYPYAAPYYYSYSCWRRAQVWTPYGWRWRRIWVCG